MDFYTLLNYARDSYSPSLLKTCVWSLQWEFSGGIAFKKAAINLLSVFGLHQPIATSGSPGCTALCFKNTCGVSFDGNTSSYITVLFSEESIVVQDFRRDFDYALAPCVLVTSFNNLTRFLHSDNIV